MRLMATQSAGYVEKNAIHEMMALSKSSLCIALHADIAITS